MLPAGPLRICTKFAVLPAKDLMKNYLSVAVLLIFASVASGGAILTVGDPTDFWPAGSLVEVDVTLFGLPTTLDSYQVDIDFDPGVLSAVGANAGTIETMDNTSGNITIARSDVGLNFGGTLFRLYFTEVGAGLSFVSIPASSVTLLDSAGNAIPFTTVAGSVYSGGPAPTLTPEPGSLWLLSIGMAAMGGWYLKQGRPLLRQSC